jgi:hypothetical protein
MKVATEERCRELPCILERVVKSSLLENDELKSLRGQLVSTTSR